MTSPTAATPSASLPIGARSRPWSVRILARMGNAVIAMATPRKSAKIVNVTPLGASSHAAGDAHRRATFGARGRATLGAWSRWLARLAEHGLAPEVAACRLARASAADTLFEGTLTLAFDVAEESR